MAQVHLLDNLFKKNRVLGRPPIFAKVTDPGLRATNQCFFRSAPIVTILPGMPKFGKLETTEEGRQNAINELNEKLKQKDRDLGKEEVDIEDNPVFKEIYKRLLERDDNRYFRFQPDPYTYLKSLNAMFARVFSRMNLTIGDGALYANASGDVVEGWGGLQYWVSNGSSISESATSEFGDSLLQSFTDKISDSAREVETLFEQVRKSYFTRGEVTQKEMADMDAEERAKAKGKAEEGMVESFFKGVSSTITGTKLSIPKMWKNSEFNRTYTIQFKFQSPYGDRQSILEDVLYPYLTLLPLALPRQSHGMGYAEPFMVRVDAPGWFHVDCGVVTSLTINKAPDNRSWSGDGLMTQVTIDMEVMDLYPTIMLSINHANLNNNFGLSTYLDSIAGVNYRSIGKYGTIAQDIKEIGFNMVANATSVVDAKIAEVKGVIERFTPVHNAINRGQAND